MKMTGGFAFTTMTLRCCVTGVKASILLSEEDKDIKVQDCSDGDGYARTTINGKRLKVHRVVVSRLIGRELTKEDIVDHVNRNKLDNRRGNLRLVNHEINRRNSDKRANASTKYLHVSERDRPKPFTVYLRVKGNNGNFGSFTSAEEAAYWADVWVYRLLPDEAELNYPERIAEIEAEARKITNPYHIWQRKTFYNLTHADLFDT